MRNACVCLDNVQLQPPSKWDNDTDCLKTWLTVLLPVPKLRLSACSDVCGGEIKPTCFLKSGPERIVRTSTWFSDTKSEWSRTLQFRNPILMSDFASIYGLQHFVCGLVSSAGLHRPTASDYCGFLTSPFLPVELVAWTDSVAFLLMDPQRLPLIDRLPRLCEDNVLSGNSSLLLGRLLSVDSVHLS